MAPPLRIFGMRLFIRRPPLSDRPGPGHRREVRTACGGRDRGARSRSKNARRPMAAPARDGRRTVDQRAPAEPGVIREWTGRGTSHRAVRTHWGVAARCQLVDGTDPEESGPPPTPTAPIASIAHTPHSSRRASKAVSSLPNSQQEEGSGISSAKGNAHPASASAASRVTRAGPRAASRRRAAPRRRASPGVRTAIATPHPLPIDDHAVHPNFFDRLRRSGTIRVIVATRSRTVAAPGARGPLARRLGLPRAISAVVRPRRPKKRATRSREATEGTLVDSPEN